MITNDDFVLWKNDLVTKQVHELIRFLLENNKVRLYADDLLNDPNGLLKQNRIKGYCEALEDVLSFNPVHFSDDSVELVEVDIENDESSEGTRV